MTEFLEDISSYLESLMGDLDRIHGSVHDPVERERLAQAMGRVSQAFHETRILTQFLRFMKEDPKVDRDPKSLEWTARLTSLDTLTKNSRN